jgi:1,4-alpha-glucan branching enzyme
VLAYERAGLLFVVNLHSTNSFTDYRVGVEEAGEYKIVLSSDDKEYGGWSRVDTGTKFFTTPLKWNERKNFLQVNDEAASTTKVLMHSFKVYIPSRVALVLAPVSK